MASGSTYGVTAGLTSAGVIGPSYRRKRLRLLVSGAARVTINTRPIAALGDGWVLDNTQPALVLESHDGMGPACCNIFAMSDTANTNVSVVEELGSP
jgi:hypothetical protein